MPTAFTIDLTGKNMTKNRATGGPVAQVGEKSADRRTLANAAVCPADADMFARTAPRAR